MFLGSLSVRSLSFPATHLTYDDLDPKTTQVLDILLDLQTYIRLLLTQLHSSEGGKQ